MSDNNVTSEHKQRTKSLADRGWIKGRSKDEKDVIWKAVGPTATPESVVKSKSINRFLYSYMEMDQLRKLLRNLYNTPLKGTESKADLETKLFDMVKAEVNPGRGVQPPAPAPTPAAVTRVPIKRRDNITTNDVAKGTHDKGPNICVSSSPGSTLSALLKDASVTAEKVTEKAPHRRWEADPPKVLESSKPKRNITTATPATPAPASTTTTTTATTAAITRRITVSNASTSGETTDKVVMACQCPMKLSLGAIGPTRAIPVYSLFSFDATILTEWMPNQRNIKKIKDLDNEYSKGRVGTNNTYYDYLLVDPTKLKMDINDPRMPDFEDFLDSIFYVGKGKKSRVDSYYDTAMNEAHPEHHSDKIQRILKLWESGKPYLYFKPFENMPEDQAFDYEAAMIFGLVFAGKKLHQTGGALMKEGHISNIDKGNYKACYYFTAYEMADFARRLYNRAYKDFRDRKQYGAFIYPKPEFYARKKLPMPAMVKQSLK